MKVFADYDLKELRRLLRVVIPKDFPIPNLNKNSTEQEVLDAVTFLEQQGKYNQKLQA